jgi:MFS superfamily sulfate permease-like transporter
VVVLDADAVSDIDYTGTRTLRALLDELERAHITLAVARAVGGAPQNLARSGLSDRIGRDHVFATVDAAVTALHTDSGA